MTAAPFEEHMVPDMIRLVLLSGALLLSMLTLRLCWLRAEWRLLHQGTSSPLALVSYAAFALTAVWVELHRFGKPLDPVLMVGMIVALATGVVALLHTLTWRRQRPPEED